MDMKRTLSLLLVLITFSAMAFEFANGLYIGQRPGKPQFPPGCVCCCHPCYCDGNPITDIFNPRK